MRNQTFFRKNRDPDPYVMYDEYGTQSRRYGTFFKNKKVPYTKKLTYM